MDLLISSGRIRVRLPDFYVHLGEVLEFYGITIPPPRARHLAVAWSLRMRYGLTYFDSLHAATAIVENEAIASYDSSYT
ncbi:MAG: PIN domain-containing protein [Desulfurococcales archaeon]|nr:PIN domain-containing protein [Desulfurococcales archaeon]